MSIPRFLTISEQVAAYLNEQLLVGRWVDLMPGKHELAALLGVNSKTVETALHQLEADGVLVSQGVGKRRLIKQPSAERPPLRVGILLSEKNGWRTDYMPDLVRSLERAGHLPFIHPDSLEDCHMDVKTVSKWVAKTPADAWIVTAASRGILEWFCEQPVPSFALFGRRHGLPMASVGPDMINMVAEATRHLVSLGHKRIVLMMRLHMWLPTTAETGRAFLRVLEESGLPVGGYNVPKWEESVDGFHAQLDALFRFTPPTALIIDEVAMYHAAFQFLARKNLQVPEDVSLVSIDEDASFSWCKPSVAHIRWDRGPVLRRVVAWANHVSLGKEDRGYSCTKAEFIPGGTIGEVKNTVDRRS